MIRPNERSEMMIRDDDSNWIPKRISNENENENDNEIENEDENDSNARN